MADVGATIAALTAMEGRLDEATRQIVADIAHLIQGTAMSLAPVGVAGNSTNMPGDLRRSILVDGPEAEGPHTWFAQVGPTVIYGRQRELGGAIFPKRAKFLRFTRWGRVEFHKRVYQRPEPYLKPAYEADKGAAYGIAVARVAAAIEEG